ISIKNTNIEDYEIIRKTVGPEGGSEFISITGALKSIVNNSNKKRYIIYVRNGTYIEYGLNEHGLELKDFVDIIGESKDGVIIKSNNAPKGKERDYSTIKKIANCTIKNVTLYTYNNKYCVHADSASPTNMEFKIEDCILFNENGYDKFDLGFGIYYNQKISIKNCILKGRGIFGHNASSKKSTSPNTSFTIDISGNKMKDLIYHEYFNYGNDELILTDNTIENYSKIEK